MNGGAILRSDSGIVDYVKSEVQDAARKVVTVCRLRPDLQKVEAGFGLQSENMRSVSDDGCTSSRSARMSSA